MKNFPLLDQLHRLDPALIQPVIVIGGCLLAVLFLWLVFRRPSPYPYTAAKPLLSAAERLFYSVLQQAVDEEFALFTKVRLADIICVRDNVHGKRRSAAFNRIKSKHADFVLCDPDNFKVLCVIELDDRSHREHSRRQRDAFVDAALDAAEVPILHVPARRSYSAVAIREAIHATMRGEQISTRPS
ncbi:MAG: hypothetical protein JWL90_717 [Chthoniobacteraceae bacterium]|nr:hypothetical protein [Chthoniobacteraceae bacterium]